MQEEVFIVGGGPSLRGFDFSLLKNRKVIATNAAIFDIPNADYFITIDATFKNKIGARIKVLEDSRATKLFVANFANPYIIEKDGKIIDQRFSFTYDLDMFDTIIKSHRFDGFGKCFKDFRNGANSGYCALQLAIILGYKKINLLGIDLSTNNRTHYHNVYSGVKAGFMEKFVKYWETGLVELKAEHPDIEVISCSKSSRLNSIIKYRDLTTLRS